ncbi:GABA permease [Kineosphaera limosa]|nr:amino acid permease [Kineosphaera limosa]NYE00395.1 GABA permease [Kineosphaera limosa]
MPELLQSQAAESRVHQSGYGPYARRALGNWAGFSVAWLYWYFWVIVVGFEAVAGAKLLQYWVPGVPLWIFAFALMAMMTATNLFSVSSYGEFEYWFAGIKVVTIILFLLIGTVFVLGIWPGRHLDFSNLTAHGGFMPHGAGVLFSGIVVVIFSMVGAEIATVAAAESDDPVRGVTKAVNSVVWRIGIFYVGSIFLLVVMLPWNDTELGASPYVTAFKHIGLPYADHVMNAVVLTAVLSCLNSGLYTASRMLFVLAGRREAPAALLRVTKAGVPRNAILASTVVGFLCVIAAYISPEAVFMFLLNSSGAVIIFVYILIAISQLILRRQTPASQLVVKMWGYPWLTCFAIVAMVAVLVMMAFDPEAQSQITLGLASWALLLVVFFVVVRTRHGYDDNAKTGSFDITPTRVLMLANDDVDAERLVREIHRIHAQPDAAFYVSVPANPVDVGTALTSGAVFIYDDTRAAAQRRLDAILADLTAQGYRAEGEVGHFDAFETLESAANVFGPDAIVIATSADADTAWLRDDTVGRARERFSNIPVHHLTHAAPAVEA